jgi:hypothetical protein
MAVTIKEIGIGFSNTRLGSLQTPLCIKVHGYESGTALTAPSVKIAQGTTLLAITSTGPTLPTFVPDSSTTGSGVVYAVVQIVFPTGVSQLFEGASLTVTDGAGNNDSSPVTVYVNNP